MTKPADYQVHPLHKYYKVDHMVQDHAPLFDGINARRVLNLGCGRGESILRGIASHGIDFNDQLPELWRRHIGRVPLRWKGAYGVPNCQVADARDIPFPDGEFEWTVSTDFFEHIKPEDLPTVIAESTRVAPKGLHVIDCVAESRIRGVGKCNLHPSGGLSVDEWRDLWPDGTYFHKAGRYLTVRYGHRKRVLIMGNGPSLNEVPVDAAYRDDIISVGVNRLVGLFRPDWLGVFDSTIEEEWVPKNIRVISHNRCKYLRWPGAVELKQMPKRFPCVGSFTPPKIPEKLKPVFHAGNSPLFVAFWALSNLAPTAVGVIGVEHTQRAIHTATKGKGQSHWYGVNPEWVKRYPRRPQAFNELHEIAWRAVMDDCAEQRVPLHNLCPYAKDTPFGQSMGIDTMDYAEWCLG